MTDKRRMSDEDRDYWAGRRFDQIVATNELRSSVEALGHPPVVIEKRVQGVLVDEEGLLPQEPEIETTQRQLWAEPEQWPSPLKSMEKKARLLGYDTRVYSHHGERRGAHGRLLAPPEADYATLVAARGQERFLAMWEEVGGKWKFSESLDFTPDPTSIAIPVSKKITQLRKDRLTDG